MKALVFGSNGYLGRHVAYAARERGWDVRTTDVQGAPWNDDPTYCPCDVRDAAALSALDWGVDFAFLFGGLSGAVDAFDHYADQIDVNEKGLVGILDTIRCVGSQCRVIFPSSRLVYRGQRLMPLKEEAEKEPRSIYAVTKLAAENYLNLYARVFDLRFTIFRICVPYANLVGEGFSYGTMGFFLRHALQGQDLPLYGDGEQRRTFTHLDDLLEQVFAAIALPDSEGMTLNIDGGDQLSIRDVAELVAKRLGVGIRFLQWPELARRCESGDTIFDATAIRELTGHACKHRLADWIKRLDAKGIDSCDYEGRAP